MISVQRLVTADKYSKVLGWGKSMVQVSMLC